MRTLKLVVLALILVALVLLALANREAVTLNLLPDGLAPVMPVSVTLPLFVVCLLSVVVGMIVGYLVEWLREHKHRHRANQKAREAERLDAEVKKLRKATGKHDDDVLALLGG